jgi:hypothetical protein
MIFLEEGFSQEEYRAFCATGDGGGVKNDCSSSDGGGATPRATSAWKSQQGPVFYPPKELAKKPPAKSLAKAGSVAIMDGELTAEALKSIGVTLDQAVKACAAVTPDSHITISHGSLMDIAAIDDSNPERVPSGVVTVLNDMTINGMDNAVATAVSLSREQDSQSLVMAYTMLKVSSEAQKNAQFSIARQMMKGTVDSITQAEKIGVDRVEMLAAGSSGDRKFKGYRIWPRLGFDGVIPRKAITPTYTLATGLFNSYGSKIPKEILSPRAKQEMKEGALTVQALYETDGGQKWWEQYGSEIVMTLDIGDSKSPGWNRFKSLQAKFSSRSIDMFEAFFDAESADVMDQAWAEIRAYCATGEGGGQKNDCPPSSVGTAKASDDWKSERKPISMTYDQLDKAPPVTGGDVLDSFSISDPQMTQEAMKNIGIPTMDDLVTLGGGVVRRGDVAVFAGGDDFVTVNLAIPVSTTEDYAGSVHTQTVITQFFDDEGRPQSHLAFEGLVPKELDRSSDRDVARVTSIMMQRVVESMARADDLGFATASMEAVGDASRVMKGYRLWPQFGFDGEIPERTQREIPSHIVEQVWRKHRPDLFATRVPASAILRGLRAKPITIQQLISITEGDRWWDENGGNIALSLDFNDKSSLGYKKFKEKKDRLPRLRERNKSRSMEEWIEDLIESRACDDSDRQEGGRFGPDNDCGAGGGGGGSSKPDAGKKPSIVWTPGTSLASVTQSAVAVPATVRSDDGKRIISTSLGSRDDGSIYEFPKGTEYVGTVEVGRHLVEQQAPERGAAINTGKKLDSTSRSYITSSLVHQVQTATDRGIRPAFYSPEERARQIEVYSEITPEIKGGRLKDGTSIDTENAEHLFRALQALTSPNASPFGNMQRTDSLLQKFFRGDGRVTTSTKFGVTGGSIISGLGRYQAIVDRLGRRTDGTVDVNAGLAKTRELFTNTVMKSGDFEEFFGDIFGGNDDDLTWKPGSYLVGEEVPLFCTFGPKVGTFFANNNGELDHLTADIWWTRTWGRISGELVKPASAESGKKHADKLVAEVGNASADQLHGVDGNELLKAANQMKSTGIVPDVVRIWASARLRHYAAGDYKEKKGVAGRLNKVAKNIVDNDVSLMGDPGSGTRRSNMIAVAREAARKAGQPVAYMQDILWQDEQDAYAAAGAKTVTSVGSLSLYSDTIARLAADKESRLPAAKKVRGEKRSLEDGRQETEFDDYALGGREQMLYAYATAGISDEDFADRVIALAEKATKRSAKESRAFCPTGDEARSCERESDGKFASGNTCQIGININDKDQDFTGQILSGEKTIETRPTDSLRPYVGKTVGIVRTGKGKATLVGTMKVGEPKFYKTKKEFDDDYEKHRVSTDSPHYIGKDGKHGYPLTEIKKVKPLEIDSKGIIARVIGRSHDFDEIEYTIESRAFCPTGSGGGLDNSCGSGDGLLKSAVARWKGFTSEIDLHLKDEVGGKSSPSSASGSKMREQAKALLNEVIHNSTPAPTLYRGDDKPPSDNDSTLLGWTSSKTVAEKWAKTYGGAVYTLENATGLDLSRFGRLGDGTDDFQESEWIVLNNHPKKDSRAFCPTGTGGGVKNDCSSSDKGTGDISAGDKSLASYEGFSSVGKTKNSDFISVPSDSDITTSLKSSQQDKVGAHRELPAGYPIDLRIDISAYENHDTYVVTAHEHVGGAGVGTAIGYDSIIRLKGDVSFKVGETAATKIGRGKTNKNTHSTVKGNFDPSREVPADIDSWTPVGYNPKTATYYYDKRTGKEVTGGVDSVSVGNTVFVRVPKYGNAKDPSKPPRNAKTDFRDFCPTGEGNDAEVRGDAPAPKKDRITGSDKNAEGSASGKSGDIELKDSTVAALKSKAEEHNSAMEKSDKPNWTRVRVPSLKAVFRRGAGAFSVSHRPGMTRDQWAMARVNAFLTLARRGRPENAKYVGDNDLLHADHPRYSKSSRAFCPTGDGGGIRNDCGSNEKTAPDTGGGSGGQATAASSTTANSHAPSSSTPIISKFYDLASSDKAEHQAIIDAQTGEVIHQDRGKAVGESADVFDAHVEIPLQLLTGDRPFHQIHTHPDSKETFGPSDSDWGMLGWGNAISVTTVGPDGFYQISRPTTGKTFTPKHLRDSWEMAYSDTVDRMESDGSYSDATISSIIDKVNETLASRLPGFSYSFTPRKPLTQSRSADCGRDDSGKFGSGNDCAKDGSTSTAAAPAKSSQFSESISDSNGKHDWENGKGDPPFDGAGKYAAVGISAPKQVAKSLDSVGVTPSQLLDMSGANAGGETVYVRPAPEFKNDQPFAGSGVIPLFVDYSRDIAGVKDGLSGSSVVGAKKSSITGETSLNIYHNMITVAESVRKDPAKRQTAAREFYRAMVSSVEAARKAGVTRVHLNAAGEKGNYYRGYTIWPRMGFDAPIPAHVAAKLPPDLSHAKTLLDLHATREGTRWWAGNGDDVDVSLDITDRSSPQNKLFDRFSKRFGTDSRSEYPGMPSLDGWLSEEDTAKIEGVWEEIWDSDLLDDYSGEEQNFDVDS